MASHIGTPMLIEEDGAFDDVLNHALSERFRQFISVQG
jgi:hypothetical protein